MAGLTVIPRGFGGSTMLDVLNYSDRIVYTYKPRAIVLYEGDNDISSYAVPLSIIEARYRDFIKELRSRQPETRLYVLAIKPSIARWHDWTEVKQMNSILKALCEEDNRLIYVDIATPMLNGSGEPRTDIFLEDDLHMNKNGYKIWTSVVYPLLRDREGQYEAGL
jgi:lysophospholipase L1-like esterase